MALYYLSTMGFHYYQLYAYPSMVCLSFFQFSFFNFVLINSTLFFIIVIFDFIFLTASQIEIFHDHAAAANDHFWREI